MRKVSLFAALLLIAAVSFAAAPRKKPSVPTAPKLEDLPRVPLDTLSTADSTTKIIIYANNTWSYYRPGDNPLDELPVYRNNWDTTQVFADRTIELSDLPSHVNLPLVVSLNEFHYPLRGKVFSPYGPRGRRNHNGVDLPLKVGEPVYATFEGKVRYAKYNGGGFGYLVILRHKNGLETWYAHLSKLNVRPNDYVKAGQVIGFGGSTGRSRGPHLHFEVRYCDQTFDPQRLFDFEAGSLKYMTFALEKAYFNIHSRASDQLEEDDDSGTLTHLLAESADGEDVSGDILENIAKAQQQKPAAAVQSSAGAVYHTIRQGDMLGSIARRYGTTVDRICKLNPGLTGKTVLRLGRRIRVK